MGCAWVADQEAFGPAAGGYRHPLLRLGNPSRRIPPASALERLWGSHHPSFRNAMQPSLRPNPNAARPPPPAEHGLVVAAAADWTLRLRGFWDLTAAEVLLYRDSEQEAAYRGRGALANTAAFLIRVGRPGGRQQRQDLAQSGHGHGWRAGGIGGECVASTTSHTPPLRDRWPLLAAPRAPA
jgi:hypothetical protein